MSHKTQSLTQTFIRKRPSQNGSSMMKVAEGAVSSTVEILKTLKEKAVNAANDSNTDSDRQTIQKELDQSIDQINDNANVTFNGKYLVDGSKNTIGNATYTALSNQSLSEDTKATTKLTELAARNGDSLEIHDTDKVTVSYVQGGKTYSTTFQVKDETTGKVATLQDIFKAAEDINKDSKIFATSDNESVLAAQVKDGSLTEEGAKNIATAIETATNNYNTNKETYDNAISALATTTATAKDKVDDYNEKAASWVALVEGTTLTAISTGTPENDGEYLSNLEGSTAYGNAITVDLGKTSDGLGAAATATVKDATLATIQAAFTGTAGAGDTDAIKAAIKKIYDEGDISTDAGANAIKDKITALQTAMDELETAAGDMKTAVEATGLKVGGTNDGLYKDYVDAKTPYETSKDTYEALTGPKLLEGKTVGVAASNDTVETASGENAITITANKEGINGQISGFNISITDSEGNVKKSANAALDAFEETVRAQNESKDNAITLQVGAKANQSIKVGLTDMRAEALGLQGADGTKLNISTQTKANAAINVLDNAIAKALDQQTTIGSVESRLEYTSSNLTTASENVQASESTIRDADMAKEMTQYTKNNVLLQAAQSMLAQANQSSSNVLSLLQ